MEAVILVGGRGSRLGKLTETIPKPMLPMQNNKTLLELILDELSKAGIRHAILACGYLSEYIQEYFKKKYNNQYKNIFIDFSIEKSPLGTGGAVLHALPLIKNNKFFVCNGDTIANRNLLPSLGYINENQSAAAIVEIKKGTSPKKNFIIDANNQIQDILSSSESPQNSYIATGLFLFRTDILRSFFSPVKNNTLMLDLELDIVSNLILQFPVFGSITKNAFMDIGELNNYLLYKENGHEFKT